MNNTLQLAVNEVNVIDIVGQQIDYNDLVHSKDIIKSENFTTNIAGS